MTIGSAINSYLSRIKPSFIITLILSLLFVAFIAVTSFSLRTMFYDFNLREVALGDQKETNTPGDRFDQALLGQISAFEYIKSFDHVLKRGPVQTSTKPLQVDRCEVRQGDFYKFVQWRKLHKNKPIAAPSQPRTWNYLSNSKHHKISGRLDAPANGVTYYDSYAYCKSVGGRLPFGDEWIATASGKNEYLYPWGNELKTLEWPYLDPLLNAAQRCGLHKETATPNNIHNMGGVVSEWAQNRKDPLKPTIHGGNAYNTPREIYSLNALYRYAPAEYRSPYVGFRCVYEKKPAKQTPWKTKINTAKIKASQYETGIPRDARLPSLLTNLPHDKVHILEQLFKNKLEQGEKSLFVMESEVTRKQYNNFLQDPLVHLGLYADKNEPKDHNYFPQDWDTQIQHPELPVVNIDWWSAHAFASWAGGRLPSSNEWIMIASAQGKNIYPWGNKFSVSNTISGEKKLTSAQISGSAKHDITADGVLDLGGNVSEWTQSTDVTDGNYTIVVKGGNYLIPGNETTRIDFKNTVPPNYQSPTIGLRIVFDRKPANWNFLSKLVGNT